MRARARSHRREDFERYKTGKWDYLVLESWLEKSSNNEKENYILIEFYIPYNLTDLILKNDALFFFSCSCLDGS